MITTSITTIIIIITNITSIIIITAAGARRAVNDSAALHQPPSPSPRLPPTRPPSPAPTLTSEYLFQTLWYNHQYKLTIFTKQPVVAVVEVTVCWSYPRLWSTRGGGGRSTSVRGPCSSLPSIAQTVARVCQDVTRERTDRWR